MTDVAGNPEEERRAEFYHQPWSQEAVSRYFYCKVRRARDTSSRTLPHSLLSLYSHSTLPVTTQGRLPAPPAPPGPGVGGVVLSLTGNTVTRLLLPSLKIQQRRQELEQSLVVRNT